MMKYEEMHCALFDGCCYERGLLQDNNLKKEFPTTTDWIHLPNNNLENYIIYLIMSVLKPDKYQFQSLLLKIPIKNLKQYGQIDD